MARVTVEQMAFQDSRFDDLADRLKETRPESLFRMMRIWSVCTDLATLHLTTRQLRIMNRDVKNIEIHIFKAQLSRPSRHGWYIRGTKSRVKWLSILQGNGRFGVDGGRPRKEEGSKKSSEGRNPEGFGGKKAQGFQKNNPQGLSRKNPQAFVKPPSKKTLKGGRGKTLKGDRGKTLKGGRGKTPLALALAVKASASTSPSLKKDFITTTIPGSGGGGGAKTFFSGEGAGKSLDGWQTVEGVTMEEYSFSPPPGGGKRAHYKPCPRCKTGSQPTERVEKMKGAWEGFGTIRIRICDSCRAKIS